VCRDHAPNLYHGEYMRVFLQLSNDFIIKNVNYPANETEIHSELYCRLKKDGFLVRAEYPYGNCRFDLVVFNKKQAIAIIEVKSEKKGKSKSLENTGQGYKYRQYGIPLIQFYNLLEYDKLVEYLKNQDALAEATLNNPSETTTPLRYRRLRTLYGRLRSAVSAAFDAKMALTDSNEKQLVGEIEDRLDEYFNKIKNFDNLYIDDKSYKNADNYNYKYAD
jgi:hypothetical protein